MDVLRELIQTIIVIVVLAVLVEMLLPGGDMRRYVKMVMGLLIIMAVMQAAAGVIHSDLVRDIPAVTAVDSGAPPLDDIMAAGQGLAREDRELAVQQYSKALSGQVLALARMNGELQVLDARVTVDENSAIEEINIVFAAADGDNTPSSQSAGDGARQADQDAGGDLGVQPVVVDIKGGDVAGKESPAPAVTPEQERAAAGQAAMVAEFYNLRRDQVKYEFRDL
ncbi:stage III sporulation protein AF [Desulfallas thermosapovorans]|uniref:Stage III sporulation protein AF n=1 Tax=Desulfallas thermosapovorans DSM 6562 TaxID=1121431 RepID=A0A5S4ZS52_9FIRM|nr:stage III sporulation protein AF [Desulfallas thermosapovorans]TYO95635.1 stage III sporulation protein AF [Desulfallas thermosapovorans DSM 6562]